MLEPIGSRAKKQISFIDYTPICVVVLICRDYMSWAAFFRIDVASTIFMLPAEPVVPGRFVPL